MPTKPTARQLDKLIEAAQNAIEYQMQGSGDFPFDMLRYDLCWPATEQDSRLLPTDRHPYTGRVITLKGLKPPTQGRWASFGWVVVSP